GGDLILAGKGAKFADRHAKLSLRPGWGLTQRLPRRIGVAAAKRMMFTGEVVDGEEAKRLGLADWLGPADGWGAPGQGIDQTICEQSADSIAWMKRMIDDGIHQALSDALAMDQKYHQRDVRGPR